MTVREKLATVITRLIRLTHEGKLKWTKTTRIPSDLPEDPNDRVAACYETEFRGRRLALYEARGPRYSARDEDDVSSWSEATAGLAVLNNLSEVEWRFPGIAGLDDLLDAVRYNTGNIDQLLDDLARPE